MDIMSLPKNMRDKIMKLAEKYSITIDAAKELFSMANGNYQQAEFLCDMKANNKSDEAIKEANAQLWQERQQKFAGSLGAK